MALLPLLAGASAAYGGYKLGKSALDYFFPGTQSTQQQQQGGVPSNQQTGNFLTGYNSQLQQLPRFSQEQQGLLSQVGQGALQGLQQNPANFGPIADLAQKRFQERTIPTLAERFTSLGASPTQFQGYAAGAGADLQAQLAAMQSQHELQQRGQYLQQAGLGLQPSFENIYIPQTSGLLGAAAPGLAQYGLQAAASNPEAVGAIGSSIGDAFGSAGLGTAGLAGAGLGTGLAGLLALLNYIQGNKNQQLGGGK
jgi:hypothetical protein